MGERKGQNKYYPPDFDYKKHKSLAGYHGQHPLRERARKLHQGILIIRFEMPYNIWCDGCNKHVAMGVRYNAEKSKIGMYYTTPIYQFRMKCHLCDNHYVIKTDPANHDYVITSGARRKEQRWDPHENEQIVPEDRATQKKLSLDSMYKLEHGVNDQVRSKTAAPTISQIVDHQAAHKDDFLLNQLARKKFRDMKKVDKEAVSRDDEIKKKFSLEMDLVAENKEDARLAQLLQYSVADSYDDRQKAKRKSIESRPLFSADEQPPLPSSSATNSSSSSSSSGLVDHRKMASLSHMRQLSDSTIARRRVAAFSSTISPRPAFSSTISPMPAKKKQLGRKLLKGLSVKPRTQSGKAEQSNKLCAAKTLEEPIVTNCLRTAEGRNVLNATKRNCDDQSTSLLLAEHREPVVSTNAVRAVGTNDAASNALSSLIGCYDSTSSSVDSD